MSETQQEETVTRTVRQYRHDARNVLNEARDALSLKSAVRNDSTLEVHRLLNGSISSILAGIEGLSQEQQVERLDNALTLTKENAEQVTTKIAEAKEQIIASVTEALETWDTTITGNAQRAVSILEEARNYAATRDFEAWQERKHRGHVSEESDSEDTDDEDDDDE